MELEACMLRLAFILYSLIATALSGNFVFCVSRSDWALRFASPWLFPLERCWHYRLHETAGARTFDQTGGTARVT